MPDSESRSFAPVDDDELPADVLNFVKLFKASPAAPEPTVSRTEARARRRAARAASGRA